MKNLSKWFSKEALQELIKMGIEIDNSYDYTDDDLLALYEKITEEYAKVDTLLQEKIELDAEKINLLNRLKEIDDEKNSKNGEIKVIKKSASKNVSLKHQLMEYLDKKKKS